MKNARIFLYISMLLIFLASCGDDLVGPQEPQLPAELSILTPSAEETYWTDRAVRCAHDASAFTAQWQVDGETVSCTDGELSRSFSAGEYSITATISADGESVTDTVNITVKEGFSVALVRPEDGAEYFVGEKLACEATVAPAIYESNLEIIVGGRACTGGTAEIQESGEVAVVASVTIDSRTEVQEVMVMGKPVVAGQVYPLTDQGVTSSAGNFTVTLKAGGEVTAVETDSDGSFTIKSDRFAELPADELVTLEVAASGDFYGARADRTSAGELVALGEADELGFILAPKRWRIRNSELAGNSTNLKLEKAFTRFDDADYSSSFYMLKKRFGKHNYAGIASDSYKVPVAFDNVKTANLNSGRKITASDSTTFWAHTREETEPYVGRGVIFTPATIEEVPDISDGVQVWVDAEANSSGASGTPSAENPNFITGGLLKFDDFSEIGDTYTQTHEQFHNLGFGHTRAWDGIMTYGTSSSPGQGTNRPTVNDIAHMQVYIDTFDLQYSQGISFGVLEWMLALDIEGLPETTSSAQKVAQKHSHSYVHEVVECVFH